MTTTVVSDGLGFHSVTGLTTSEASDALKAGKDGMLVGCVQALDGGGTGFNAGTVTIQASLDGTNWHAAKDVTGTAITFTADGYAEFSLAARYIRALNDGTVSDVDIGFIL